MSTKLKLNFFLFFLISHSIINAQEIRDSSLKGKPRFVMEESYEGQIENGTFIKVGKDRQISWMNDNKMEFDRNGNLLKRSFYDDNRIFIHAEEYEFNNLRLNKKILSSFIYTYKYDNRGNVIEELVAPITDSTEKKTKFKFDYDIYNRLSDVWEFDFRGGHVCHQTNTYNAKGLLIRQAFDYIDGNEFKTYNYDLNDHLIKMEWFDSSIGLLERTIYTYFDGILNSEFWEGIEKNKVESSTKIEYDKNGNVISVLDVNPKRQIHDLEVNNYIFDQSGNWIKKTTAVNDTRFYIVERIIAYY